MWRTNLSTKDRTAFEKLGNEIIFWYPSSKKPFSLVFLKEFLEMNDAWGKFIKNFNTVEKKEGFAKYFNAMLKGNNYRYLLTWAFEWNKTTEGVTYWSSLNDRFMLFLNSQINEGYDIIKTIEVRNVKKNHIQNVHTIGNNSFVEPIYALLSGATNMMQIAYGYSDDKYNRKRNKIEFKVPITKTSIFGTSL